MEPEKTMDALDRAVKSGKAKFAGCCNYPAWLVAHSNTYAKLRKQAVLSCNQIPYNLIERGAEIEVLPHAKTEHIAVAVYRPLVMGLLTGKYEPGRQIPGDSRGKSDPRIADWVSRYSDGMNKFLGYAEELGVPPAALALAWVRFSPAVTCPVTGVSSLKQLNAGIKAFDFELDREQYDRLTGMFDTSPKEESGGKFAELRRNSDLVKQ